MGVEILPAGAYMMPTGCEYCGAPDSKLCDCSTCQRPAFYFQKKRPPFCKADALLWDPVTDHANVMVPPKVVVPPTTPSRSPTSSPFEGSWVSGLFGGNHSHHHAVITPPPAAR